MDFSLYNDTVQKEISNVQRLLTKNGRGVFLALKRLQKAAAPYRDHTLNGYVDFTYAHACYLRDDREPMFRHLEEAIRHLLRGTDPELLSRAYNLFAVAAQRSGCFDVAHYYFRTAYTFVKDNRASMMRGVIEANLGDLMLEMGDYDAAIRFSRRSIPRVQRHKKDPLYYHNMVTVCINYGLNCIYVGDVENASSMLPVIKRYLAKDEGELGQLAGLWYRMFYAHLALAMKEEDELMRAMEEVVKRLPEKTVYSDFLGDAQRFCRALMDVGENRLAGKLVRAMEQGGVADDDVYRKLLLAQLKVEYYTRTKNARMRRESYTERHNLYAAQQQVQQKMYYRSVRLMTIASDLHREQDLARAENERLLTLSETDALTQLPNRYALNRMLEQAFDEALKKGQRLGVGIADIDQFKLYNDRFGHARGDACLCEVGAALQKLAKERGIFAARYGGDEFVMIYRNLTDEQIRSIVYDLLQTISVRMTHGFYNTVPGEANRPWEYLANADARMYEIRRKRS